MLEYFGLLLSWQLLFHLVCSSLNPLNPGQKVQLKTNIETLEMREIKFPKVTVCPPKNTLTDPNYDLMLGRSLKILLV